MLNKTRWNFTHYGEPMPWKRAGRDGLRAFNASADAQHAILKSFIACCPDLRSTSETQLWSVSIVFYVSRRDHQDIDNLAKNVLDALTPPKKVAMQLQRVWRDDSQVRELYSLMVPLVPNGSWGEPRTVCSLQMIDTQYILDKVGIKL